MPPEGCSPLSVSPAPQSPAQWKEDWSPSDFPVRLLAAAGTERTGAGGTPLVGRTASPTCQRGKGSPAEGGGEQLWFLPPAPQGTLPSRPPAPGRKDTPRNLGQEKHSPPPPTHTSLHVQKSAGRYDLCPIPVPSSFHSRFVSGSQPSPLEDRAPGERATWLRVCPESRSPACAQALSPAPPLRRPLTTLRPRRHVPPPAHLSPPARSLLQELLQPTGLQHEVTHVDVPQFITGVAQGLVDEQVYGGGA